MVDAATGVPVNWARVGDDVASTVAVTESVAGSKVWFEKGTQAVPFHQSIDCPPGPRSVTVMVREPNELPEETATS